MKMLSILICSFACLATAAPAHFGKKSTLTYTATKTIQVNATVTGHTTVRTVPLTESKAHQSRVGIYYSNVHKAFHHPLWKPDLYLDKYM